MALNELISLCVLVCACAWLVFSAVCTLSAPSGVYMLNGWGKCWPLLSIKDNINLRHESVSAASHPWTADNRPQHGGHGWKQSSSSGSKILLCRKNVWPPPPLPTVVELIWLLNVMFMDGLLFRILVQGCCSCCLNVTHSLYHLHLSCLLLKELVWTGQMYIWNVFCQTLMHTGTQTHTCEDFPT